MKDLLKKISSFVLVLALAFAVVGCKQPDEPEQPQQQPHTHSYVEGKCACGQKDPNWKEPEQHQHAYGENDYCSCGEFNPNHQHAFAANGYCFCGDFDPNHEHAYAEETAKCACGALNYNDPRLYYQSAQSEDLGSVNYWDSKESTVGNLIGYVHNGFWGTRMNEYKDGYEWYSVIANEKPRLLNSLVDGEGNPINLGTKYEFEVKVGEELLYNTLSQKPEFAAFKGTQVQPEDYLTMWIAMFNQANGIERGTENQEGAGSIKGVAAFYEATEHEKTQEELVALWKELVAYDYEIRDGKCYIQVEFNVPCNPFYAMYYLASSLYAPMPQAFLDLIGGLKYYGTFSADNTLSPVDTTLSTGYYVAKTWELSKEIVFVKNELIDTEGRYQFQGVHIQTIAAAQTDREAVFKEFLAGHLDGASIPSTRLEEYQNHELATVVPDSSTYKLNVNSCTQEEWEALFGENGSVSPTAKENYWVCEPIMSNDNFLRGLSYSINRKEYAETIGATPTANYFGSDYLADPENGVTYNSTQAHIDATQNSLANTDGYGYNLALAQTYFKAACDELIAAGVYEAGQEIEIEIAWQTQAQADEEGVILAKYIEEAFNSCGGQLTVKCKHWVATTWSDVYYKKMMVGQFDLGFGSVSGNSLNPLNFLEVLRSDNSSGFTLNWGVDTGKVSDQIFYDGQYWSFDALWQAADSGAYVKDGELAGSLVDAVLIGQTVNEDGSVDVQIKWAGVNDSQAEFAVSAIAVCNYEVYYQGGDYEEIYVEFEDNDGIVSFTIPAEYNAKVNGFIGYDVYFDSKVAGVPGSTYVSLYASTNAESICSQYYMGVWSEPNAEAAPEVPEGGQVFSYVASSYEERTKIIGILEKFAVENFITGLTLYGDGGYTMYADRLVPGSGSWDNYVPGYGFGVFGEGSAEGFLTAIVQAE